MQKFFIISTILLILTACSAIPPEPSPRTVDHPLPLAVALANPGTSQVIGGYLLLDSRGARLAGGLSFTADASPAALDSPDRQIWVDLNADDPLLAQAQPAGDVRYLGVMAAGVLEGPGAFGPEGAFGYRLNNPTLTPMAWQETTIVALEEMPPELDHAAVRVTGALITTQTEALLVDRLGDGGVPEPGARQIKLEGPIHDTALLARLNGGAGGSVRYGMVQVEGIWYGGKLAPLGIRLIETPRQE